MRFFSNCNRPPHYRRYHTSPCPLHCAIATPISRHPSAPALLHPFLCLALLLMASQMYLAAAVGAQDDRGKLFATIRLAPATHTRADEAEAPARAPVVTDADTSTAINRKASARATTVVAGTDHSLVGELALTVRERQVGLMNRPLLDADAGMLFVFERPEQLSFWMKDTFIELSIAFLDRDGVILNIEQMEPFSLDSVPSVGKAQYALEANHGYFAEHGITDGAQITLTDCPTRSVLLQHAPQKAVAAVLRLCQ